MAQGILGLGSANSASLNQDLLDKLKEAEKRARVEPIEKQIEDITSEGGEKEKLTEIIAKVNEFLETIKPFDLFVKGGVNAFEQKSANVRGTSAIFDAVNVSNISEGTTSVKINQLAQKDVYQTMTFSDKEAQVSGGNDAGDMIVLSQNGRPVYQSDTLVSSSTDIVNASGGSINININGANKTFNISATTTYEQLVDDINSDSELSAKITSSGRISINASDETSTLTISDTLSSSLGLSLGEKYSTEGKTYEDLAKDINKNSNYNASIETTATNANRLVIKSVESGLDNAINITQVGVDLELDEATNHTLSAQNLLADVDGINYNVSSNVLVVNGGLKITAVEVNDPGTSSTISVQKDTSNVSKIMEEMVTKYNELMDLVDNELYSSDSKIEDKSTLRTMVEGIKSKLFNSYGENDNLNMFNFGINLNKSGDLSLDSTKFNDAVENNIEDLKSLFIGVAEKEGLGTQLKSYVDSLDSFDGLLTKYGENIDNRRVSLEEEKEKAQKSLDSKYSLLAQQFAAYTAIITQFESQFSGLKLMIQQSTAS